MGRVNAIAFHPTDENIIFVGAPSGGLWKTTDAGKSWYPLTDNLASIGVSTILIHPTTPDVMWIGTGDRDSDDAAGLGVYKSTDGGKTWSSSNTGFGPLNGYDMTVAKLIMHPTNSDVILAVCNYGSSGSAYRGIFKTINGGRNWSKSTVGSNLDRNITDILFHPSDPTIMYATTQSYSFLLRSTDTGENWSYVSSDKVPQGRRSAIAVSPAQPDWLYVLVSNDDRRDEVIDYVRKKYF